MQGLVLIAILGGAIAGWVIRQRKMAAIVNEPLDPVMTSAVRGAEPLRDSLSHLLMELDGGVEARGVQSSGSGASVGLGGGWSVQVSDGPGQHIHTSRDEGAELDVLTRMRETASAWRSLQPETRSALRDRGVDGEFIDGLLERDPPTNNGEASVLARSVRAALDAFSVPTGDGMTTA